MQNANTLKLNVILKSAEKADWDKGKNLWFRLFLFWFLCVLIFPWTCITVRTIRRKKPWVWVLTAGIGLAVSWSSPTLPNNKHQRRKSSVTLCPPDPLTSMLQLEVWIKPAKYIIIKNYYPDPKSVYILLEITGFCSVHLKVYSQLGIWVYALQISMA